MIDRIIESFTKPKMEITALDEFIQSATLLVAVVLAIIIYIVFKDFIENRRSKRK